MSFLIFWLISVVVSCLIIFVLLKLIALDLMEEGYVYKERKRKNRTELLKMGIVFIPIANIIIAVVLIIGGEDIKTVVRNDYMVLKP